MFEQLGHVVRWRSSSASLCTRMPHHSDGPRLEAPREEPNEAHKSHHTRPATSRLWPLRMQLRNRLHEKSRNRVSRDVRSLQTVRYRWDSETRSGTWLYRRLCTPRFCQSTGAELIINSVLVQTQGLAWAFVCGRTAWALMLAIRPCR